MKFDPTTAVLVEEDDDSPEPKMAGGGFLGGNLGIALGAGADEYNKQQQLQRQNTFQDQQFQLFKAQNDRSQETHDEAMRKAREQYEREAKATGIISENLPLLTGDRQGKFKYLNDWYAAGPETLLGSPMGNIKNGFLNYVARNGLSTKKSVAQAEVDRRTRFLNDFGFGSQDRSSRGYKVSVQETPSGARLLFFDADGAQTGMRDFSDAQIDDHIVRSIYGRLAAIDPGYAEKFLGMVSKPAEDERAAQAKRAEADYKTMNDILVNDARQASEAAYRQPDPSKQYVRLGAGEQLYRIGQDGSLTHQVGASAPKPLTEAQQLHNYEVMAARNRLKAMSPEEIRRKTQRATDTGRDNADFDPTLARQLLLASRRLYGNDPWFDAQSSGQASEATAGGNDVVQRFQADPAMRGFRLGKQTARGAEVFDGTGKLVGHYQ
ncbi:hypothetical protein [Propionivibrio sp.]|uniref:hypothetical protein n=1 Tax=Propionivibrio sp. TaxID=2212460 RepID=UPI0039E34BFD